MSSSNITDPAAIQALLDQLRSSEAWQKAVNPNTNPETAQQAPPPASSTSESAVQEALPWTGSNGSAFSDIPQVPHVGPQRLEPHASAPSGSLAGPSNAASSSVASLLSQLQASSTFAAAVAGSGARHAPSHRLAGGSDFPGPDIARPSSSTALAGSADPAPAPTPRRTPREDLRSCTFQQALPHIARLAGDEGFVQTLATLKAEQADLERQLWTERREIQKRHEERVTAARTRASIIGAGLTRHEADAMTDSFRGELLKFDRERVLPAWDGMITKQQAALESLGVPAMFPTTQRADRERQQEIMQVLGRIVKHEGSSATRSPGGDG